MRRVIIRSFILVLAFILVKKGHATEIGSVPFYCNLNAEDVALVSESTARGYAALKIDRATQKLSWKLTYEGLSSPPIDISIHGPAGRGGIAKVLKSMTAEGMKSPVVGSWTLDDGQLELLLQRQMYIEIATDNYKNGEIRCQIERGAAEGPPRR